MRRTSFRAGATATAGALLLTAVSLPTAASADGGIDTNDRAAVTSAYNTVWLPTQGVSDGWTGSAATCNAGSISDAAQQATLTAINFARGLEGLAPVAFNADYSAQAQAAALMMKANNALSHTPPTSWNCYTDQGAAGAGSSNLYLGLEDGPAIGGYLTDPGDSNTFAGHRRWILDPEVTTMGHGATDNSDALKVFGDAGNAGDYPNPSWVSWPSAGYFPVEMEPKGRWSLAGQLGHDWDFTSAVVTVRDESGTTLPVTVYPQRNGYGADTLVWKVDGLTTSVGLNERDYTVNVTGIVGDQGTTATSYVVRLFDPEAKQPPTATPTPTPAPTHTPTPAPVARSVKSPAGIHGTAKVGKTLTAVDPVWKPASTHNTYSWYRNGHAIPKATKHTYKLVKKDRKARITVRVTAAASKGYLSTSSTSARTPAVK